MAGAGTKKEEYFKKEMLIDNLNKNGPVAPSVLLYVHRDYGLLGTGSS